MENTLLIIDGSALLTTAYYSNLPDAVKYAKTAQEENEFYHFLEQTKDGIYTNAVSVFLKRLDKLIDTYSPSHIAVTFDENRKTTFRVQKYPEYKGNRKPTPFPLKEQKETIKQILQDMNITVLSHERYEGDDIIGSLCKTFGKEDMKCVIYANDRDMTQLVNSNVRMWYTCQSVSQAESMYRQFCVENHISSPTPYNRLPIPQGCFVYSPKTVQWKLGVLPNRISDWKGLGGDKSDNIPGVKGISEKTAAKILKNFDTIETLYATIETLSKKHMEEMWKEMGLRKAALTALLAPGAKENALISKYLATILTDLPIFLSLDNFDAEKIDFELENEWKERLEIEDEKEFELMEEIDTFLDMG